MRNSASLPKAKKYIDETIEQIRNYLGLSMTVAEIRMRDGLVEVLPRKGIVVRPITQDEVRDMVDVRQLNECFCARLAADCGAR